MSQHTGGRGVVNPEHCMSAKSESNYKSSSNRAKLAPFLKSSPYERKKVFSAKVLHSRRNGYFQRWSFPLPFGEWHSRMVRESLHVCHSPSIPIPIPIPPQFLGGGGVNHSSHDFPAKKQETEQVVRNRMEEQTARN